MFNQKLRQLIEEANQEKSEFERKVKEEMDKKIESFGEESKTQINSLNTECENLRKNNKNLITQINDFDKKIE